MPAGILWVPLAGSVKLLEAAGFSEEMIRQAKAKAHSSRLHFSVQDATNLPYSLGTFDGVVISNALSCLIAAYGFMDNDVGQRKKRK